MQLHLKKALYREIKSDLQQNVFGSVSTAIFVPTILYFSTTSPPAKRLHEIPSATDFNLPEDSGTINKTHLKIFELLYLRKFFVDKSDYPMSSFE
jgi:hypothetical protein